MNVLIEDLGLIEYKDAWQYQEKIFSSFVENKGKGIPSGRERLIFCEHPHVYTLGRNGSQDNLLLDEIQMKLKGISFFRTNRGGDITYHGPGQIVCYPIIDLENYNMGVKDYVRGLEQAVVDTLSGYEIAAGRLEGATGVWLGGNGSPFRKICAIGIKASRNVTMHGFAFNIKTDLTYFSYINPCGFTDKQVTSLEKELGHTVELNEVKEKIIKHMARIFGFVY